MRYQKTVRLLHWPWLLVGPLLVACSTDDPCFQDSKGKEYRVKVVELWDGSSRFPGGYASHFPCPVDFDLVPGGSFTLRVDAADHGPGDCHCGSGAILEAPGGWSWTPTGISQECNANFFSVRLNAEKDPCKGEMILGINAARLPTGAAVPGQPAPADIYRWFQKTTSGGSVCPLTSNTCNDKYVAEIEEL